MAIRTLSGHSSCLGCPTTPYAALVYELLKRRCWALQHCFAECRAYYSIWNLSLKDGSGLYALQQIFFFNLLVLLPLISVILQVSAFMMPSCSTCPVV